MAISNVPSYIGSSAVENTGERWMSAARTAVFLPAPGWLSEMAGKVNEIVITLTGSNHNFDSGWLSNYILEQAGGSIVNKAIRIIISAGTDLVGASNRSETIAIYKSMLECRKITIENHGRIIGRGGNGGYTNDSSGTAQAGAEGKTAIFNEIGNKLFIENHNLIAGGGGGGGAALTKGFGNRMMSGGGGAPFGPRGSIQGNGDYYYGGDASFDSAGGGGAVGNSRAGAGGAWGNNGANGSGTSGSGAGGLAGYACSGTAPVWTIVGDRRGRTL